MRWQDSFPGRQFRVRPIASLSAMALTGMIVARRFAVPSGTCLAACALTLCLIAIRRLRKETVLSLVMLLGFCLGGLRMAWALERLPEVRTQYSVHMVGRVVSEPFVKPETGRLIMKYRLCEADDAPSDLTLRLYLRGDPGALEAVDYGQTLALTGHIWENDPVTNPYEFDFGEYLHRNGMAAIATAKIEDVEITGRTRDLQSVILDVRWAIAARIDALFPQNAAMVRALVLGDRSLISEETRESLSATGTAHLISISGMHVTLLAMALTSLLTNWLNKYPARRIVLVFLAFYGALIGFTAPFVRALTMFALYCLGAAQGEPSDPLTLLGVALMGFLAVNPLSITDSGLILSFSASAGIILLVPPLQHLFGLDVRKKRRPTAKLLPRAYRALAVYFPSLLCASLAAQLATIPAVVACFGVQSIVSVPFNLVCVPLCMAGYILSMAALVLSVVLYPLGALLAMGADKLFTLMLAIMRFSARLPLTSVRIGRYPDLLLALHAALIIASSGLMRIPSRVRRFLPFSLILVAGLSSLTLWLAAQSFGATFLDAENADSAVVRTRGHTYVFDAGDTYTPLTDYLNGTALNVDAVFLSHPHQDHAGGLYDLLESFRPKAIYVPKGWFAVEQTSEAVVEGIERAREMGVEIRELSAGDAVRLSDAAVARVYSPRGAAPSSEVNDISMLTRVECDGHSILFTGDLTIRGEPESVPRCEVLKVAHHGADNATSDRFLADAAPEIAVISVGENNFGHPGEETLARLEACGARILRTDARGAITLTACDGGWRVKTFLEAPDEME